MMGIYVVLLLLQRVLSFIALCIQLSVFLLVFLWDRFLEVRVLGQHKSICTCPEYHHVLLHVGYIILHSHQQCMVISVSPQSCQQSMLSSLWVFLHLICKKWQLIMVLTGIFFFLLWAAFYMVKDHVIFLWHLFIFLNHFSKALLDVLYTSGIVLLCDKSSNYYVRNMYDFSFSIQLFSYSNISH